MTSVVDLRAEFLTCPLGIDEPIPRLSWRLESDEPGKLQTAYQVIVGTQPGASDLWDTGRLDHLASPSVEYRGTPAPPKTRVWWQVTVWDEKGREVLSEPTWWETGILEPDGWNARWIQGPLSGGPRTTVPATYLLREFRLEAPVQSARLYITALGLYEATLNGTRIGDHHLSPGWTDYRKRVRYQTFDVASLLREGANQLAVVLGDGWYCGHVGWRDRQFYGDRPKLLCQLECTHGTGETTTIISDESWKCGTGPIIESDLLMGESYDARRLPNYDWPVQVVEPEVGELVSTGCPPIRKMLEVAAVSVTENKQWPASRWIFDFGQNLVGHVRLKVRAPSGRHFTIRHAEVLDNDGRLYTENLRGAKCFDSYTAKGGDEEIWEPAFTFHGFRYVEITGFEEAPSLSAATAIVVHSDLPQIGTFECSDPDLNQLQHNILWGWRGNSVDVPTDCPQRDERLGWTGDAQVFAPTACFNTFSLTFFEKFVQDLEDAQGGDGAIPPVAPDIDLGMPDGGPAWSDAFALVPMSVYRAYGDRRIVERHYPAMVRWLGQQEATARNGVRCYEGYPGFTGFGDWLNIDAETRKDLIGTAYFAQSAAALADAAALVGNTEDRSRFQNLAGKIRTAFLAAFPLEEVVKTQTAIVLALGYPYGFSLAEDEKPLIKALVENIRSRGFHLSTGFVGAPCVLQALARGDEYETAFRLLEQRTWPSWLYPVTQGATTIWERWDGWTDEKGFQDAGMNSFNHYAYGSVGDWIYSEVVGIKRDPNGGNSYLFNPHSGGSLTSARASLMTLFGKLEASWQIKGESLACELRVPADVTVTASDMGDQQVYGPGSHRFSLRQPPPGRT